MNHLQIDQLIINALREDRPYEDITTENLIGKEQVSKGKIISKEDGIISGIEIFSRVFKILDLNIEIDFFKEDGDKISKGEVVGEIHGSTRNILIGERVALNFLQRLSGISSITNKMVKFIESENCILVDTRKTTPGLRYLEKYAVRMGGGKNHRFNLSDAVMIKDNHISAMGGITKAVDKINKVKSPMTKIEIEVKNIEEFKEALSLDVDVIMLDNMSIEEMKKAVNLNESKKLLEASGNIDENNIAEIAKTGVNIISCGGITHSVKAQDFSLIIE